VAKVLIETAGMSVRAFTIAAGGLIAQRKDADYAETDPLRCADPDLANEMAELIRAARNEGDSVGGVIEVNACGVPPGLGDPVFAKLDGVLAWAMLSIGGVKGVEFGSGFDLANMRGSQSNDPISPVGFLSNHAGGVLGGVSTGEPIVMRLAVKPTPSISKPQTTVDIHGAPRTIEIKGRHDPFLCPRICPVAEAMTAVVLADALMERQAHRRSIHESIRHKRTQSQSAGDQRTGEIREEDAE
jgi:chorismate synthase